MEFNIICPVDGTIAVSLEDIDTVVLRDSDHADITFACPQCGTQVTVSAVVPSFLLSAIEALSDTDSKVADGMRVISAESIESLLPEERDETVAHLDLMEDDKYDAYCEYFRRQLHDISSVEDALREMDSRA